MTTKLVRVSELFYADSEINSKIERLENDGYNIINIEYIGNQNSGYGLLYHFLIIYE